MQVFALSSYSAPSLADLPGREKSPAQALKRPRLSPFRTLAEILAGRSATR
jgi:hypothetical protein